MKLLKKNISIVLILTIILTLFNSQAYASETNVSERQSLDSFEKTSKPNIVLSIK